MAQYYVRNHLCTFTHTFVLLNLGGDHFLVLLNEWHDDAAGVFIPHRAFLFVPQHDFHVIDGFLRVEGTLHVHVHVLVVDLLQLPLCGGFGVWLLLLLDWRRCLFPSLLGILPRRLFCLNNLHLSIGISLAGLSQLPQLLFQVGLVQINRYLLIPLFRVNMRRIGHLNLNIGHIGHLNPPTLNSDHCTSQQLL